MSAAEKVHYIGKGAQNEEQPQEETMQPQPQAAEAFDKTSRDMSKVALFVSFLAVVLMIVFFFGQNQKLDGLSAHVKTEVAGLNGRMVQVEDKIVALETLPKKSKMMVMGTMLQDMAQRAAYLGSQMDTEEQNAKLRQAMELMQQVQSELVVE